MECVQETIVGRPSVMHQKPRVGCSQNQYRLFVPTPRQNGIDGHLLADRHMHPLQVSLYLPPGCIGHVHRSLPHGSHQPRVGGPGAPRQARERPVQTAATHCQSEAIGQHLPHVPQREPHLLVENRGQGQRFRPQLDRAHAHRIGGLQRMPSLYPTAAIAAATYRDIEAADHGAPHNFLLILRFVALQLDPASTVGTLRRQRHGNRFIHPARESDGRHACHSSGPACGPGVGGGPWFGHRNVVRLGAFRLAGRLPTLGAGARFPARAVRSPAVAF